MISTIEKSPDVRSQVKIESNTLPGIVVDAYSILASDSHLKAWANRLSISVAGDTLLMRGCLPSFFLKQMLQERLRVLGMRIVNETTVRPR